MDAFNTVFKSPGKDRVSMARDTDVGGFSVRGRLAHPDTPTTR